MIENNTYYDIMNERFDEPIRQLGWTDAGQQKIRFDTLTQYMPMDLSNKTVLDIGCGHGDLWNYFPIKPKKYVGIDMYKPALEKAKKKYEKEGAEFLHGKFLEMDIEEQFDYVICCGALNVNTIRQKKEFYENIFKMADIAKEMVAFNFLSSRSMIPIRSHELLTKDPSEVMSECLKLSPLISVIQNYISNEASVLLHKIPVEHEGKWRKS